MVMLPRSSSVHRDADRDRSRLDVDPERLLLRPAAAVELVPDLLLQRHVDRACLGHVDEVRLREVAELATRKRAAPLDDAVRVGDTELEEPVVRAGVVEDLEARERLADVAEQDAAGLALVPLLP